jgi:hypothetical protein
MEPLNLPEEEPARWEDVRDLLIPIVRLRSFFSQVGERPKAHWLVGGDLAAGVMVEHPKLVIYVTAEMLTDWDVEAEVLFKTAQRNLARRTRGKLEERSPGLFQTPWNDTRDASRLALPSLFTNGDHRVAGQPVAVALSRNHVLVTGSEDPLALDAMFAVVRERFDREDFLSPVPVILDEDRWLDYVPENSLWRDLIATHRAELYRQQGLDLDKHYADQNDLLVALLLPVRVQERLRFTLTNWPGPVDTLLPMADWVTLGKIGSPNLRAYAWADAHQHFGNYLQKESLFPTRFRTSGFPTQAELAAAPSIPMQDLLKVARG